MSYFHDRGGRNSESNFEHLLGIFKVRIESENCNDIGCWNDSEMVSQSDQNSDGLKSVMLVLYGTILVTMRTVAGTESKSKPKQN